MSDGVRARRSARSSASLPTWSYVLNGFYRRYTFFWFRTHQLARINSRHLIAFVVLAKPAKLSCAASIAAAWQLGAVGTPARRSSRSPALGGALQVQHDLLIRSKTILLMHLCAPPNVGARTVKCENAASMSSPSTPPRHRTASFACQTRR